MRDRRSDHDCAGTVRPVNGRRSAVNVHVWHIILFNMGLIQYDLGASLRNTDGVWWTTFAIVIDK